MASSVEVWLWLLLVMKPANKITAYILHECSGDAAEAARNIRDGKYDFLNDTVIKNAQSVRTRDVRAVMERCAKHGIKIITMDDPNYPSILRGIENPPIVLFCLGETGWLNETPTLSVVGTRKLSDYGTEVTRGIVEPIVKLGAGIISGLAVGADAEAHRACIKAGGRTVGVLGCGILVNYPAPNEQLKRDIIKSGGAVISEYLPDTKPLSGNFLPRNRIISGLSPGTLIIEADSKSGALNTASHALEQKREVFCVPPHDITKSHFAGVVPLLRDGATPVYSYTDILASLINYFTDKQYILDYIANAEKTEFERDTPKRRKTTVSTPKTEDAKPVLSEKTLSEVEPALRELLRLIADGVTRLDELTEKSGAEYSELIDRITELELEGYVTRNPDGNYALV